MYSVDLSAISLDEFSEILHSVDLLPGRRVLLNHIQQIVGKLKKDNLLMLSDLQKMLKKKSDYIGLSKILGVDEEYLAVLNREINSYESKPLPLSRLEFFEEDELKKLSESGINTTKDYYERFGLKDLRMKYSSDCGISGARMDVALQLVDLLRVNGVGPVFAKLLNEIGIKNAGDLFKAQSEELLRNYEKVNLEKNYTKAKLGLKDIEYCKRFCGKLDKDIEW